MLKTNINFIYLIQFDKSTVHARIAIEKVDLILDQTLIIKELLKKHTSKQRSSLLIAWYTTLIQITPHGIGKTERDCRDSLQDHQSP